MNDFELIRMYSDICLRASKFGVRFLSIGDDYSFVSCVGDTLAQFGSMKEAEAFMTGYEVSSHSIHSLLEVKVNEKMTDQPLKERIHALYSRASVLSLALYVDGKYKFESLRGLIIQEVNTIEEAEAFMQGYEFACETR